MRTASDLAEWWDKQHAISKTALDEFVDENPGLFGVVLATALATAMEVGKGTVDVLRLGEGLAEGTVGGVGTDALRALSIVGTVGKGAKIIKEVVGRSQMMKLIVDPGGGKCIYASATQALRQTGQKAYMSVDDLAKELGETMKDSGLTGGELRLLLLKLKAAVGPTVMPSNWKQIERMVPRDGSVVSFGMKFTNGVAHRVYAFRDGLGRVKIMDRGGSAGKLPEVFNSLEELLPKYVRSGVKIEKFTETFQIKDLFLRFVGPKGLATLAMEVLATTTGDAETTAQMFEAYKEDKKGDTPRKPARIQLDTAYITAGEPLPGGSYVVKRGDSLSKIAERAYGNMMKYPVIYMANKRKIGPNPNLIQPGQELYIPVLS